MEDPTVLAKTSAKAKDLVRSAGVPDGLRTTILDAYQRLGDDVAVAVRSSATSEDTAGTSFAGMNETYTNVIGRDTLISRIVDCGASAYGQRVVAYRDRQNLDEEPAIAVVVQQMVHSERSGVLFTADPASGDRSRVVVEGAFGLGEVVVSGAVQPDTYTVTKDGPRLLAHVARDAERRRRPDAEVVEPPRLRHDEASALLAHVMGGSASGRWLAPDEVVQLFDCYAIPLVGGRTVATAADAVTAAREIGGPVALKAVAEGLVHKSDVGAVRLGLATDEEVTAAAADIRHAVAVAGHDLEAFLVQPMVAAGVELLVGVTDDPTFGPVVVCGAGGVTVELLNDVSVRLTPLTPDDASEMVHDLATAPAGRG